MGTKPSSGLFKRGQYWHIDKHIFGQRIRERTGSVSLKEAEAYLAKRVEEIKQTSVYGVRLKHHFKAAATKYLLENQHKASIACDAIHLEQLCRFIGNLTLEHVHMGTLQSFIKARKEEGRKTKTINNALGVVRRILNLAASEWIDEHGLTWLAHAPKIKLMPVLDARDPYPISWGEQTQLFDILPEHLYQMAIFKVNTGCREQEVCQLQWSWEVKIPEFNTSVFIIPKQWVKNRKDRLVVLNDFAKSVIEQVRGKHSKYVFTYKGKLLLKMHGSAWKRARKKANLPLVRIHDLKHTFGQRLRSAGVGFEDRQDLLGHNAGRITTHYCAAELDNLIKAANLVCDQRLQRSNLVILRTTQYGRKRIEKIRSPQNPHNGNLVQKDALA